MSTPSPEITVEHLGWKIRSRPERRGLLWSALVEVWQPGHDPRSHTAVVVPFTEAFEDAADAVVAGIEAGKKWVQRQPR